MTDPNPNRDPDPPTWPPRRRCSDGAEYEGVLGKLRIWGTHLSGAAALAILAGLGAVYLEMRAFAENHARESGAVAQAIAKMADEQRISNRYACEQTCYLIIPQEQRSEPIIQQQCRAACGR